MDISSLSICFNPQNQIYINQSLTDHTAIINQYFDSLYSSLFREVNKYSAEIKKEVFVMEIEKVLKNQKIDLSEKVIDTMFSNAIVKYFKLKEDISFLNDLKSILNYNESLNNIVILPYVKDVHSF